MALLNRRLVQPLLPAAANASAAVAAAQALAATLRPNGTFPNINYDVVRGRAGHLSLCQQLAAAWRGPNASEPAPSGPAQAALLGKITLALELWLAHDYQDPNWVSTQAITLGANQHRIMFFERLLVLKVGR